MILLRFLRLFIPFPHFRGSPHMVIAYYRMAFPYQIRRFFRREIRPLFCRHRKSFVDADWSYTVERCSKCYKMLKDLRNS